MASKPDTPGPTTEEKTLARTGAQQWNDYQQRYVPLEDAYIQQINALPEKTDELTGIASADAWQQFQRPANSARYGTVVDSYLNQERGLAAALPAAAQGAKDAQIGGLTKMTAFGRGLADQSLTSMYQIGQSRTQQALQNAQTEQASGNAWMGAAGLAAGGLTNYAMNKLKSPTSSAVTPSALPNSRQGWVY